MSGIGSALAKPVGPMPLGAWLVVGAGGLFIAYKSRQGSDDSAPAPTGDPLPTGGGYPTDGATGSYDGAPVVLSPIFNVPAPIVNIGLPPVTTTPTPTTPPRVVVVPPALTPRVPARGATKPATTTTSYTVKKGDTLWGIAAKTLGSGARWTKLYADNRATIEAAAKSHGRSSSSNGHWIYPGTVLRVVK